MNDSFHAWVDGDDAGPYTLGGLRAMANAGKIDDLTPVRQSTDTTWSTWEKINQSGDNLLRVEAAIPLRHPSDLRDRLRFETAYPRLRLALNIFAALDVICAAIFLIAIFLEPDATPLFVTAAAASLIGLVPLSLGAVVIDIADASLKKL